MQSIQKQSEKDHAFASNQQGIPNCCKKKCHLPPPSQQEKKTNAKHTHYVISNLQN
jgi:hypothetical protein